MKVALPLTVEAELANIRPVILGAVVRGLEMENDEEMDAFIKQLMDHQENSTSLLVEDVDVQAWRARLVNASPAVYGKGC